MKHYTKRRPPPPPPFVENPPLIAEDYPRLFALGNYAAKATESRLDRIVYYDHNKIGMKAYLEKLGFTFIFRKNDDWVYVAMSGEALLGCTDTQLINGMIRQIKDLNHAPNQY